MIRDDSQLVRAFWEGGRVEGCPIIDCHGHMGPWGRLYFAGCSPERMLAAMDRCGVELLLFCSHEGPFVPAARHATDIDAVRAYPKRFRSYFGMNANSLELDADFERFVSHPDVFVGLKTLPGYFGVRLTDERYRPFFEYASDRKMPLLSHTWGGDALCDMNDAETLLTTYPGLHFVAGHSYHGQWREVAEFCRDHERFYLDLCAVVDERGPLELFLEICGSTRIVFGTDIPWFDPLYYLGAVLSAPMTDEQLRDILYRNAAAMLSDQPWFRDLWTHG